MKTITYIYKDFPSWNCKKILNPEEYAEEMRVNRKFHKDITETEGGAVVRLHRFQ